MSRVLEAKLIWRALAAQATSRLQSVRPFCLTIDREAPRYAARVFGNRDYALLRQPERIPEVLITVLRQLLRS